MWQPASAGTDATYPKEFGVDAKYGLTPSLTLDLTYNTDFAQVEVDEQRTNLTRFPLFFPEKRTFFLEGADIFGFGLGLALHPQGIWFLLLALALAALGNALSVSPVGERVADLERAIDILKSLKDDETRGKAAVYMEGLIELRKEWKQR